MQRRHAGGSRPSRGRRTIAIPPAKLRIGASPCKTDEGSVRAPLRADAADPAALRSPSSGGASGTPRDRFSGADPVWLRRMRKSGIPFVVPARADSRFRGTRDSQVPGTGVFPPGRRCTGPMPHAPACMLLRSGPHRSSRRAAVPGASPRRGSLEREGPGPGRGFPVWNDPGIQEEPRLCSPQ